MYTTLVHPLSRAPEPHRLSTHFPEPQSYSTVHFTTLHQATVHYTTLHYTTQHQATHLIFFFVFLDPNFLKIQVPRSQNFWISRSPNSQISRFPDFQVPRFPNAAAGRILRSQPDPSHNASRDHFSPSDFSEISKIFGGFRDC